MNLMKLAYVTMEMSVFVWRESVDVAVWQADNK